MIDEKYSVGHFYVNWCAVCRQHNEVLAYHILPCGTSFALSPCPKHTALGLKADTGAAAAPGKSKSRPNPLCANCDTKHAKPPTAVD